MITIRPAHTGDIPWLLEQLREFDKFMGTKRRLFPENAQAVKGETGALNRAGIGAILAAIGDLYSA